MENRLYTLSGNVGVLGVGLGIRVWVAYFFDKVDFTLL